MVNRMSVTVELFPRSQAALPAPDPLIREAHHRVSNSLALVAGLVRMRARDIARRTRPASLEDMQVLLEELGHRVQAVGQLHRRLSEMPNNVDVDLAAYLREIAESAISSLSCAQQTHLAFQSNGVSIVPAHRALHAGLIVSELMMNAVKYAHPSGVAGKLHIACNRIGDGIVIDVIDDGIGFPEGFDPMTSRGLGFQLVRSLTDQLKGLIQFHDSGIGVRVTLSMPLSADQEVRP